MGVRDPVYILISTQCQCQMPICQYAIYSGRKLHYSILNYFRNFHYSVYVHTYYLLRNSLNSQITKAWNVGVLWNIPLTKDIRKYPYVHNNAIHNCRHKGTRAGAGPCPRHPIPLSRPITHFLRLPRKVMQCSLQSISPPDQITNYDKGRFSRALHLLCIPLTTKMNEWWMVMVTAFYAPLLF